jgi:hypothetical protein
MNGNTGTLDLTASLREARQRGGFGCDEFASLINRLVSRLGTGLHLRLGFWRAGELGKILERLERDLPLARGHFAFVQGRLTLSTASLFQATIITIVVDGGTPFIGGSRGGL